MCDTKHLISGLKDIHSDLLVLCGLFGVFLLREIKGCWGGREMGVTLKGYQEGKFYVDEI